MNLLAEYLLKFLDFSSSEKVMVLAQAVGDVAACESDRLRRSNYNLKSLKSLV